MCYYSQDFDDSSGTIKNCKKKKYNSNKIFKKSIKNTFYHFKNVISVFFKIQENIK